MSKRIGQRTGPLRVLVVEDDRQDAYFIMNALDQAGETESDLVTSGAAAVEAITEGVHDIVLLDLNMPGITGRDVLKTIRTERGIKTPIIVLSTSTQRGDIDDSYALNANAYIVKPYGLDEYDTIAAGLHNFWHVLARLPGEPRPG
ncbi:MULTISPECIES: response regulator [Hyphobacterium]|uniref:Response regulator n=1 Tax=Hyphobacterium vulgare TaxID=1736751 RepID=A0ABV6ZXD6_9PROT